MKRPVFRATAVSPAVAGLLIAVLVLSPVSVRGESDAEKAIQKAADAVQQAENAAHAADAARSAAAEAQRKAAPMEREGEPDDAAARTANNAAQAADDAQDSAQKKQQEAAAAAEEARNAKGIDREKNEAAAKLQKEAEAAAAEAKKAEAEAARAEKAADDADKNARLSDKKDLNDAQVNLAADERLKRKQLRAARRAARRARRAAVLAIPEAERMLAQQTKRKGGDKSGSTEKLEELLRELRRRIDALVKAEESRINRISEGNFLPDAGGGVRATRAGGLQTILFDVPPGRVIVYLPDDIRAGDTISGTVVAEPKGNTPAEQDKNRSQFGDYVIGMPSTFNVTTPDLTVSQIVPVGPPARNAPVTFRATVRNPAAVSSPVNGGKPVPAETLRLYAIPNQNSVAGACGRAGGLVAINETCRPVSQLIFTSPPPPVVLTPPAPQPPVLAIPGQSQTGRPVTLTGPFDGDSANTRVTLQPSASGGPPSTVTVIAESPRQSVFISPVDQPGVLRVTVNEGTAQATGNCRNIGVNLSAPRTNLTKGEMTTLTVKVTGLEGIMQPVAIRLDSQGPITMQGGSRQQLVIQPSQVGVDGTYATTRAVTGVQPGGWSATATVVDAGR